jgi:hypothetical protein
LEIFRRARGAEADCGAMAGLLRRHLHDDAVAERAERLQVELGGAADVAHVEANMIDHSPRSTICRFSEEIAAAGLRPLGQALVQLRMVWQR